MRDLARENGSRTYELEGRSHDRIFFDLDPDGKGLL
jgi:hypothetical protein